MFLVIFYSLRCCVVFQELIYACLSFFIFQLIDKIITEHLICEFKLWWLSRILLLCLFSLIIIALIDGMSIWTKLFILLSRFVLKAGERI